MRTTDIQQFWNVLGSFWGEFEDKALIEQLWLHYFNVVSGLEQKSLDLRNSLGFSNMPGIIEDQHESLDIVYSVNSPEYSGLINSYLASGQGDSVYRYEYNLTPGTVSIPELTYTYYSDSGTLSAKQTLSEGTDYEIRDMERVRFLGSPPFEANQNQTHFNGNRLLAETVYRTNPAIWGIEALRAGLDETDLSGDNYNAFVSGYLSSGIARDKIDVEHFKYLVWSLQEALSRKPAINNIRHLYELLHGLPFAHNSGVYQISSISGDQQDYTITGIYSLYPIGTGYDSTNSTDADYIYLKKPTFEVTDKGWEIVARGDDAYGGIGGTWLFSNSQDIAPSGIKQYFGVRFDTSAEEIIFEANGAAETAAKTDALETVASFEDYDPYTWHRYNFEITDSSGISFYIDDQLIGTQYFADAWSDYPSSGLDYTFIGGWATNSGVFPYVTDKEYPYNGWISRFRTYNLNDETTSHVRFIPRDVDETARFIQDIGPSGYVAGIGDEGNPLLEYLWQTCDQPLIAYSYLTSGQDISQFQVLYSGIKVNDHINNYTLISGLIDFEIEKYRHITITDSGILPVPSLTYNPITLTGVLDTYIPAHLTYGINENLYSGIFVATWGDDANDGSRRYPVATFSGAASLVTESDTIWYRRGSYHEQILTSSLVNSGISWDAPLRVRAFPGEVVRLTAPNERDGGIVVFNQLGESYVKVEDFDIDGLGYTGSLVSMASSGSSHGWLYNCHVHGNTAGDGQASSITMSEDGHRITHCEIGEPEWHDHHGIYASTYGPRGRTCSGCEIAYNEMYGHDYSIHMNIENWILTIDNLEIHHNHIHDSQVGVLVEGGYNTYVHNNLIEYCGWGIAAGYYRQTILAHILGNTIRRCAEVHNSGQSFSWAPSWVGIRCGTGSYQSVSSGALTPFQTSGVADFCISGIFYNNAISECDISYYDPSGVADPNNFYNSHSLNMDDSGDLPTVGYNAASTNISSGLIFYYGFQTAEAEKDFGLHPYFSSGCGVGVRLDLIYPTLTDIGLDYSGISRPAGLWDIGAYETIV
jgi:hypothetical protein